MNEFEQIIQMIKQMTPEEVAQQFEREIRPPAIYYEGSISFLEEDDFYGIRLDGLDTPENSVFLDDAIIDHFGLEEGQWTEPANNKFRVRIERLDK
jgi:hypothetical protein